MKLDLIFNNKIYIYFKLWLTIRFVRYSHDTLGTKVFYKMFNIERKIIQDKFPWPTTGFPFKIPREIQSCYVSVWKKRFAIARELQKVNNQLNKNYHPSVNNNIHFILLKLICIICIIVISFMNLLMTNI